MVVVSEGERRTFPRVDFSGITLIHTLRREIHCVAGNISESGILLYPQETKKAPTSPMRVTFALPLTTRWIELEGALVRQAHMGTRSVWGVRFINVPVEVRDLLRQYSFRSSTFSIVAPPFPEVDTPKPIPAVKLRHERTTAPLRKSRRGFEDTPIPDDVRLESDEPSIVCEAEAIDDDEPGTNRIDEDELFQLADSLGQNPEPTRQIDINEVESLKERSREP